MYGNIHTKVLATKLNLKHVFIPIWGWNYWSNIISDNNLNLREAIPSNKLYIFSSSKYEYFLLAVYSFVGQILTALNKYRINASFQEENTLVSSHLPLNLHLAIWFKSNASDI